MKLAAGALAAIFLMPVSVAASENGAALYAMFCASCHGTRGTGSRFAPPLVGISATYVHFMLDTGRMPAADPDEGEVSRPPRFSEPEMMQLVRYVSSLSPHSANASLPRVSPGNADRGRELFAENCAQCHGAAANGASVGSANVAPSLAGASAFQIAEAIRSGPGVMPRFGPDMLSDRDVDDIASYAGFVQMRGSIPAAPNAGGFSLAHVGPVAEGFVAWFFGLGALVLFIHAIGTKGSQV